MKMIKTEDAVGTILSHDVTQIIPGEFKGRLFKKGHIIREEDIDKLLSIGKENVYVWEPEEGQLHENDAAIRIKDLVVGDGVTISDEIKEGKVDFFADRDGILRVDKERLLDLNSLGEIIVSTLHNNTPIKKGEKIGEKKGESRLGALMNILLKNKRYADAEKASEDEVYHEQLYKEYKL